MADTLNYMIFGYVVIFVLLGAYVVYLLSLKRRLARQRAELEEDR